jgi:hypothetical protein
MMFVGFGIALLVACLVSHDAGKRGMNTVGWGVGTFFLCIVFLPLYLIFRSPRIVAPVLLPAPSLCSTCGKYSEGRATYCPLCGAVQGY